MTSVPRGWEKVSLGEVATPRNEKVMPSELGDTPFIGMDQIEAHSSKLLGTQSVSELKSAVAVFKRGDILYGRLRPYLNKVHKAEFDGSASAEFIIFPPSEVIDQRYLYFVLRDTTFVEFATRKSVGDRPRVKFSAIADYEFLLPPLAEQQRIVERLTRIGFQAATARQELDSIPRLLSHYQASVFSAVFRGELTSEYRSAGERSLWRTVRLGDIADVGTGATPKRGVERYYQNGTIPWVTSGAVNADIVTEATENITEAALAETNCKIFPAGTLLMAMYGEGRTRGKVSTLGIEASTNQALAAIQLVDENVCPAYVRWYLHSRYLEIRQEAAGGVQPNINLGIVRDLEIPLPSSEEQGAVIKIIESFLHHTKKIQEEYESALRQCDHLDAECLRKALNGLLVPQDGNDEPAAALIERHRSNQAVPRKKRRPPRKKSSAKSPSSRLSS